MLVVSFETYRSIFTSGLHFGPQYMFMFICYTIAFEDVMSVSGSKLSYPYENRLSTLDVSMIFNFSL